ncbi:MAG: hypothetical protein AAF092_05120 [Pseudomonadota bacterium]
MTVAQEPDLQAALYAVLTAAVADVERHGELVDVPVFDHAPRDQTGLYIVMDGFSVQDRSMKNREVAAHPFLVRVLIRPGGEVAYDMGLMFVKQITGKLHTALMASRLFDCPLEHTSTDFDDGDDGAEPSSVSRYRVIL